MKELPTGVRRATKEDASVILELIQELAVYEKEPDAVRTTVADIERDGFGDNPSFEVLLAEDSSGIHGFALYFYTWSTWEGVSSLYLEDLFVRPTSRGKGFGMLLFKSLAQIAVQKGCARYEWEVLDWNQPARDFYASLGAKHMESWLNYRLSGQALKTLIETD